MLGEQSHIQAGSQSYESLAYTPDIQSAVPIPPAERGLQAIVAEPWLQISNQTPGLSQLDNAVILEGPSFDRDGNLLVVEVYGGRVLRVSPDREVSVVVPKNAYGSAGIGIHKDGRIFVAGVGDIQSGGCVYATQPDGSREEFIVAPDKGYIPDDLVFDSEGGFYFTDYRGNSADPAGGVLYVSPDRKTITPILPNLSMPNGVALSPDGTILWVSETGRNLLHRIVLASPTTIAVHGTRIPYHFVGANVDSMRVDNDGNVYAALFGGGRVLVFNPEGVPIGQVLVPGRDEGRYLYTTSIAIKPGTSELYIVGSDPDGSNGMIFRCGAFAKAMVLYSHR